MAHAARHHPWRISASPIFSWLVPTFSRLAKAAGMIAAWRRRARERQALGQLNDYYLRDIGLTRPDVMIECAKPFWRR